MKFSAKRVFLTFSILLLVIIGITVYRAGKFGSPPYTEDVEKVAPIDPNDFSKWKRPDGPIKIGLQAGHWKTSEMPEEQRKLRENGGGTTGLGKAEWEIALEIAYKSKEILEEKGYVVDILPSTVPVDYWADAFVSIHADGNLNPLVRGFKVASNARDITGKADKLSAKLNESYKTTTQFPIDSNITVNMTRYYAFNSRRYDHAIHPMTPGVLIETGFASNPIEASILINNPEIPAEGIAQGIINFIENQQ